MQIAELKLGDIGRGLSHYRPVGLVVAAIGVMSLVLPGPERVPSGSFTSDDFAAGSPVAALGAPGVEASSTITAEVTAAVDAAPGAFSSAYAAPSTFGASSFDVDATVTRSEAESSPSSSFDSSSPATTTTLKPPVTPLRILAAGWSSAQAGTPLAASGVPEGSLPVGRRPGFEEDKVAFVRLTGTDSILQLQPHQDAGGQRSPEAAQINVCRVTSAEWEAKPAQAPADAPGWDCTVTVQGRRTAEGNWTFDLSVFANRDDPRGFALVPAGTAIDYQVAFKLA